MRFKKGCTILFDNAPDSTALVVYANIGAISEGDEEEVMKQLLYANYFGQATGRAILAYDEITEKVILFQWFPYEGLDFNLFFSELARFSDQVIDWRKRVSE
jgi:hypothetical protein